jgi:hypothetical protein
MSAAEKVVLDKLEEVMNIAAVTHNLDVSE